MYLCIAAGIIVIIAALLGLQCQVSSVANKQRKLDCALVTKLDGTTRKATDFEYYECIGR